MRAAKWLALFVVAVAMVLPNAANAALVNPGFEAGSAGWTLYNPPDGGSDVTDVHVSDLGNLYGLPPAYPTYDNPEGSYFLLLQAGDPTKYSAAAQTATFGAGESVFGPKKVGAAFFDNWDFAVSGDWASVQIYSGTFTATEIGTGAAGAPIATPFSLTSADVGDFGDSPWIEWDYTFAAPGTYTVAYKVRNGNAANPAFDSFAGFDVRQIPEASSFVLFGLGLLPLLGLYRRQKGTRS
jgi:hypothetical protein